VRRVGGGGVRLVVGVRSGRGIRGREDDEGVSFVEKGGEDVGAGEAVEWSKGDEERRKKKLTNSYLGIGEKDNVRTVASGKKKSEDQGGESGGSDMDGGSVGGNERRRGRARIEESAGAGSRTGDITEQREELDERVCDVDVSGGVRKGAFGELGVGMSDVWLRESFQEREEMGGGRDRDAQVSKKGAGEIRGEGVEGVEALTARRLRGNEKGSHMHESCETAGPIAGPAGISRDDEQVVNFTKMDAVDLVGSSRRGGKKNAREVGRGREVGHINFVDLL
jgi:hypothetical protein